MLHDKLRIALGFIVLLTAGSPLPAQAQQAAEKSSDAPQAVSAKDGEIGSDGQLPVLQRRTRYKLRLSDVLELSFPFSPEFNQTVTVQPDGYITLRGVDGIRVEGKTIPEATQSLQTAYGKILHDPVITLELKDFEKPYFIVGGEVGRPGKFDLRGETTVVEAVAIAGGLRDSAKHSQILLFHRVQDGWVKVKKVNMKRMLQEGNLTEAAYLQPGDFLYVPKSTFSKIAPFIPTPNLGFYMNPVRQ